MPIDASMIGIGQRVSSASRTASTSIGGDRSTPTTRHPNNARKAAGLPRPLVAFPQDGLYRAEGARDTLIRAVIIGLHDHCEIWNPQDWRERQEKSHSNPEGRAEQFASLGI